MPPPESFMLSHFFQGKDNLCPHTCTEPCITHALKHDFQGALGTDVSLPHCPAPRMAMENTLGKRKQHCCSFPTLSSLLLLFFSLFKSHSLAETILAHLHDPPCPQAGADGYREQCGFKSPGVHRGGDRVLSSTAAVIPL